MKFEFATATRIMFGRGTALSVGTEAAKLGKRALIVGGRNPQRWEALTRSLETAGVGTTWFGLAGEPGIQDVQNGVTLAQSQACELVVSIGGGSALDAGKAIAAMLANLGVLLDYLEVIGRGRALPKPSLPFIAIPTTAGTGSEVTRNAVLSSPEHKVKVSLRSAGMLPRLAIVDPELTLDLPPALTASTGMDALTQLLEAFVCSKANPMTDAVCREGLVRCGRSLLKAFENGQDIQAREDMCIASLFGGIALANAGLGAVHGFAGPLGGMFPAPHGAACAALLPHVMAANIAKSPDGSETRARYDEVARLLTGNPNSLASDGVQWVRALASSLRIPTLGAYGIGTQDLKLLAENAKRASSMKANPVTLDESELVAILNAAL